MLYGLNIQSAKINTIESYAFNDCTNLQSVNNKEGVLSNTINLRPNLIKTIENEAFYNCNLRYIYLPTSLTNLGDNCFGKSENNFKTIFIPYRLNTPPKFTTTEDEPFGNPSNYIKIFVETETLLNKYKNNEYWGKYANCISSDQFKETIDTLPDSDDENIKDDLRP